MCLTRGSCKIPEVCKESIVIVGNLCVACSVSTRISSFVGLACLVRDDGR
jgi:hypothetical protein